MATPIQDTPRDDLSIQKSNVFYDRVWRDVTEGHTPRGLAQIHILTHERLGKHYTGNRLVHAIDRLIQSGMINLPSVVSIIWYVHFIG